MGHCKGFTSTSEGWPTDLTHSSARCRALGSSTRAALQEAKENSRAVWTVLIPTWAEVTAHQQEGRAALVSLTRVSLSPIVARQVHTDKISLKSSRKSSHQVRVQINGVHSQVKAYLQCNWSQDKGPGFKSSSEQNQQADPQKAPPQVSYSDAFTALWPQVKLHLSELAGAQAARALAGGKVCRSVSTIWHRTISKPRSCQWHYCTNTKLWCRYHYWYHILFSCSSSS